MKPIKGITVFWITFTGFLFMLIPMQKTFKITMWDGIGALWVVGALFLATVVQFFFEKDKVK